MLVRRLQILGKGRGKEPKSASQAQGRGGQESWRARCGVGGGGAGDLLGRKGRPLSWPEAVLYGKEGGDCGDCSG